MSLSNDGRFEEAISRLVAQVAGMDDLRAAQALLHRTARALGAEASFFATFASGRAESSYRFVIDCDPRWWHSYCNAACMLDDPWLHYASTHSEPIWAGQLRAEKERQQKAIDLAVEAGFVSALLIPAHGVQHGRVSLLCLGHSDPECFAGREPAVVHVLARAFALELHDWWGRFQRRDLLRRTPIAPADLLLLERHCAGRSSKQIARELNVSAAAVNSRFQRLNARLGARNRRAAARLAIECGLIIG